MKKVAALAGLVLLSSTLAVGCTPNAAPDTDNRYGVRNVTPAPNRTVTGDRGRLGVRDTGPDRAPQVTMDRDRLGVRDNLGPDRAPFLRSDRALEARVEAIPGIRNATCLVSGNTAYVTVNQATGTRGGAGTMGITRNTGNATTGIGTTGMNTYTTPGLNGTYATGSNNTTAHYGVAGGKGTEQRTDLTGNAVANNGTYGTTDNGRVAGNGTANTARGFNIYTDNTISNDIKTRVADCVKSTNPSITTVYVSANPGLFNRFDTYVRDSNGANVRGVNTRDNDLMDAIRRIFPTAR
jgi:hypothetical protein